MQGHLTKREETQPEEVRQQRWLQPAVDVYEDEREWLILADVPGTSKDQLAVDMEQDQLWIEARRGDTLYQEEAGIAGFRRVFTLPAGVDGGKVSAELNHGVVAVHLPKSEAMKPRRITVKGS